MKIHKLIYLLAVLVVAACDSDGITRPPQATVEIFNGSPEFTALVFIRVRRAESTITYGSASTHQFDSGEYNFTIGSTRLGLSAPPEELTFTETIDAGFDHMFVMTSNDKVVDSLLITKPVSEEPDDNARITVVHAHTDLNTVDVYLTPPGTDLSTTTPRDSLLYGSDVQFSYAPGIARLYLTPPGDPGTVLYESGDLAFAAGNDPTLVINDPGDRGFTEINVHVVDGGASQRLIQANLDSSIRLLNGITDRMDRDVLLDGDAVTPFFSDLEYGMLTNDLPVQRGLREFTLTPVDTPGTEEASTVTVASGGIYNLGVAAGDSTDGIDLLVVPEDRQGVVGQAKLNFFNSAGLFNDLLVYLAAPGTDTSTISPFVALPAPSAQLSIAVLPGEYEITYREADTMTIRGEPATHTLEDGGVYGFYLTTSADNTMIDITPMYDAVP